MLKIWILSECCFVEIHPANLRNPASDRGKCWMLQDAANKLHVHVTSCGEIHHSRIFERFLNYFWGSFLCFKDAFGAVRICVVEIEGTHFHLHVVYSKADTRHGVTVCVHTHTLREGSGCPSTQPILCAISLLREVSRVMNSL